MEFAEAPNDILYNPVAGTVYIPVKTLKLPPVFHLPLPLVDHDVPIIPLLVDIVTFAVSLAQNPEVPSEEFADTVTFPVADDTLIPDPAVKEVTPVFVIVTLPVEEDVLIPVPAVIEVTPVLLMEMVPALLVTPIAVPAVIVFSV